MRLIDGRTEGTRGLADRQRRLFHQFDNPEVLGCRYLVNEENASYFRQSYAERVQNVATEVDSFVATPLVRGLTQEFIFYFSRLGPSLSARN